MNSKIFNYFFLMYFTSSSFVKSSEFPCGGLINLNDTFELNYKIPRSVEPSTCVWLLVTQNGGFLGLNLTSLDFNFTSTYSFNVNDILSIQQGVSIDRKDTISSVVGTQYIGEELIVKDWTLLVFRPFSSDGEFQGQGFRMLLRNFPGHQRHQNSGVHSNFFGPSSMKKNSRGQDVYRNISGLVQPSISIINARPGHVLQMTTWTLMMAKEEVAKFYKFSSSLNKFVLIKKVEYRLGSTEAYGTIQGDRDQPILIYYETTAIESEDDAGILRFNYFYAPDTSKTIFVSRRPQILTTTTKAPMRTMTTVSINFSTNGTIDSNDSKMAGEATESFYEWVTSEKRQWLWLICIGIAMALLFFSITVACFLIYG